MSPRAAAAWSRERSGPAPEHLVDLDGRLQALDRNRADRLDGDEALGEPQRVRRQERGAGGGELLHAGREVRGLSDGRVVHPEVAPDGPHDDFPRVQPDANLRPDPEGPPSLLGIASDRSLHVEGRIAGPHRVILVGDGRAEEGHDSVAHHLIHRSLVAVDGLHHPLEDGIEQLPRLFGVPVGEQLHRPLEVGEEHGDLFALALEGCFGDEDLLGEMLGGVALRGRGARGGFSAGGGSARATESLTRREFSDHTVSKPVSGGCRSPRKTAARHGSRRGTGGTSWPWGRPR